VGEMSGQNFKEGINLELTPEQELVRTTAREFVDNEIIPNIAELDREHVLSFDIIRGMADLGMLGAPIPEEYGGAIAALADAAPGVAMATLIPGGSRRIITVEQKANFIAPVREGDIAVSEAEIRDDGGNLVAKSIATHMLSAR